MATAYRYLRACLNQCPAYRSGGAAAAQYQHTLSLCPKGQRTHKARPVGVIANSPALSYHHGVDRTHGGRVALHRVQQRQDGLLMGHGHVEAVVGPLSGPLHKRRQLLRPDGHRLIAALQAPLGQQRRMNGR